MAPWVRANNSFRDADEAAIEAAIGRATAPLTRTPGDIEGLREKLYSAMWEDGGIIRDAAGLARADAALDEIDDALERVGVPGGDNRVFNLTWHDWLNLKNLVLVSRSITASARARENSRGAHWRNDFPEPGDLATSRFVCVRLADGRLATSSEPVEFTRVRPGESLLNNAAAE
jgi:fumarate reductase flavoprotein subunit